MAQKNGVQYSELARLSHFDLVNVSCTDPILLVMVKKESELGLNLLTEPQRDEFAPRLKSTKVS